MSPGLARFRAVNHPQQTNKRGVADAVDDRATDPAFFMECEAEFGPFTVDAAASAQNTKCERFWSIDDDGLAQAWAGERVWCNPPYSDIRPWVEKAHAETDAELVVMLLPANRTEQDWWQDEVEPCRDRPGSALRTRFIRGRLRFLRPENYMVPPNSRPPFGCVLLIWGAS